VGKPFVVNRHGRLVFPSNFLGELDFSCLETEEQLAAVVRRDYDAKAPRGADVLERAESGKYRTRYELMRDMALNLFWANRYAMTMYEKRPMRWRDVPRRRDDVFLPALTPWEEGERKVAAIDAAYDRLPPAFDAEVEERIHQTIVDVFRHKLHHATTLAPIKPTVAEMLDDPASLTFCVARYEPDYPVYSYRTIIDCAEEHPELEALHRMAMVLHNQYPWNRADTRLANLRDVDDDDFVVMFVPRTRDVLEFIRHVKVGRPARPGLAPPVEATKPATPVPPVRVAERFRILPRIEALAVAKGERVCTNDDVVRNAAYNWSPMSADDIRDKTGIEARLYTERDIEEIAFFAAEGALRGAGRRPEEIGAVIFCSCTSTRLLPSVATWLSGQLGMYQTHCSFDLVAACAGFPYGLAEAVRVMQDTERPVLLVLAEKFSDKIGSVRPSRMIFGDGAAALVLAPSEDGAPSDLEVLQTYASGPVSEVNSIIWPNPEFDNDVTVWGPEVKALVQRYLVQMMGELRALPGPDGDGGAMVDFIDLVVPHQANRTMVTDLATQAGLTEDQLYFNIDRVGNISAASIPIAIYDAVADGVIDRPMRIFTPGFGAGAVAGYAVVRIDPAVVVPEQPERPLDRQTDAGTAPATRASSVEDVRQAFG
jgi:3-oxoacyl-(acyl-carrier-protein) synthase III